MKKAVSLILLLLMILALFCGCGNRGESYRIIGSYESDSNYTIAFRQGDDLCEIITAVLNELAANGTLKAVSLNWFGTDLTCISSKSGAIQECAHLIDEERTLIIGVMTSKKPLSYETSEGMKGFDLDLASYICGYLGWSMEIQIIGADEIGVQLASGNIDCAMGVPVSEKSDSYSYCPDYLSSKYVLVSKTRGPSGKLGMKNKILGVAISDVDILNRNEKFVKRLKKVIYQSGTESLFEALQTGEVDAILTSSAMATYYMRGIQ